MEKMKCCSCDSNVKETYIDDNLVYECCYCGVIMDSDGEIIYGV